MSNKHAAAREAVARYREHTSITGMDYSESPYFVHGRGIDHDAMRRDELTMRDAYLGGLGNDYSDDCLYPIFDILERLLSAGHEIRRHEDGEWAMYSREGEPIATGLTFRELCVNIVLETATNC